MQQPSTNTLYKLHTGSRSFPESPFSTKAPCTRLPNRPAEFLRAEDRNPVTWWRWECVCSSPPGRVLPARRGYQKNGLTSANPSWISESFLGAIADVPAQWCHHKMSFIPQPYELHWIYMILCVRVGWCVGGVAAQVGFRGVCVFCSSRELSHPFRWLLLMCMWAWPVWESLSGLSCSVRGTYLVSGKPQSCIYDLTEEWSVTNNWSRRGGRLKKCTSLESSS